VLRLGCLVCRVLFSSSAAFCMHSVIVWLSEGSAVPQESHFGFSSFANKYLSVCETDVADAKSVHNHLSPSEG